MGKKLTKRQEDFCNYYILSGDAYDAAIKAGYKRENAKSTGDRLLGNEHIIDKLAEIGQAACGKPDRKYVQKSLIELLERCLQAKPVTKWDPHLKENVPTGSFTFDSRGAVKAIEQLIKLQKEDDVEKEEKRKPVVNIIDDL